MTSVSKCLWGHQRHVFLGDIVVSQPLAEADIDEKLFYEFDGDGVGTFLGGRDNV